MVVFAVQDRVESADGVFKRDKFAGVTGENLGNLERLRQEPDRTKDRGESQRRTLSVSALAENTAHLTGLQKCFPLRIHIVYVLLKTKITFLNIP